MLATNHFLLSTIFFSRILIFLISICVLIFFNHCRKSQSNQEQCSLCCSLPCFLVLLCSYYGPLQCFSTYFRKSKRIGVLQPIFLDCAISCDFGAMFLSGRSYFFASDKFPGIFVDFRFMMLIQALMRDLAQI